MTHLQRSVLAVSMCLVSLTQKNALGWGHIIRKMQLITLLSQIPPQIELRLSLTHNSHRYFNKQALWWSTLPSPFHTVACAHCRRAEDSLGCESSKSCSCAERTWRPLCSWDQRTQQAGSWDSFYHLLPVKSCYKAARGKSKKLETKAIISLQHQALREYSTTVPPLATGCLHRKRNENDVDIMGSDSGVADWAASWRV